MFSPPIREPSNIIAGTVLLIFVLLLCMFSFFYYKNQQIKNKVYLAEDETAKDEKDEQQIRVLDDLLDQSERIFDSLLNGNFNILTDPLTTFFENLKQFNCWVRIVSPDQDKTGSYILLIF